MIRLLQQRPLLAAQQKQTRPQLQRLQKIIGDVIEEYVEEYGIGDGLWVVLSKSDRWVAPSFSAHVSGFPARGTTNICVCGFH
jgi:ribosome biogenesis protein Nip4